MRESPASGVRLRSLYASLARKASITFPQRADRSPGTLNGGQERRRLDALAIIEDDVSFGSDREARLARLDALALLKDDVSPIVNRAARLARLDALAQIKDDVIP